MAFQWIGKQINWVVWKRVLAEHPGLLPLFDPGQEAVLEKACEDHPKLRDAVKRFGPPPKALLDEIHNGTTGGSALQSWRRGGRLPPINRAQALSKEQMQGFFADGYVHLKGVIPTALVHRALQHINACFGRGMVDRSVPMLTGLPPAEASSPHIMDLFLDPTSALSTACQSLLGQGNVRVPHGAQVAVRFPLPPLADVAGSAKGPGGKAWHVDGFGQNQHSPFTLLVGVCLSPTPRPLMGNFAVHPGAHWTLQDAVRRHVSEGASFFSAMDQEQRKPDLGPPVEVLMEPGDVVLAHQKLPHLGEENRSPFIRYQVYFRIHHVHHETLRDRWLDDLMLPFDGVRAAMA
eukprot:m.1133548 g.1133548  ORF g.1133548 m.1133548 type:complete len:348 (+) comp24427_c1_seq28:264-1307(+)